MRVFFDESGQTGCILPNKKGKLYNDNQRHFVLCALVAHDEIDEDLLKTRYKQFLDSHGIDYSEFKGSDMMKRENNEILLDFIDTMLDDKHFYICCYDKIFYLATLISFYFLGHQIQCEFPLVYYQFSSALSHEDQDIFVEFCRSALEGTGASRKRFAEFVLNYDYKKIDDGFNLYKEAAQKYLNEFLENNFPEYPLPIGCYTDPKITNLINLNAFGELLLMLSILYPNEFSSAELIHDRILEFEPEFKDSVSSLYQNKLSFADSKDEILIQYADNVASIFRKAYTETVSIFLNPNPWDEDKAWFPTILSKLMKKQTYRAFKFDTSIADWALPFSIAELFSDGFQKEGRNNANLSQLLMRIRDGIEREIIAGDYSFRF